MKRLLALFLCLVMALSLIPAAAAEDIEIIDIPEETEEDPIAVIDPEAAAEPAEEPLVPEAEEPAALPEPPAEPLAATVATGTVGSLTWTVYDDGLLSFTGSGAIPDYPVEDPPYDAYKDQVTRIELNNGVTRIGTLAFYNFSELKDVNLGRVSEIGDGAFRGCTALTFIRIPSYVTSVGASAFLDCSALRTVIFVGDAPSFGAIPFSHVSATVYFPDNSTWDGARDKNYGGTLTWQGCTDCGMAGNSYAGYALLPDGRLFIFGTGEVGIPYAASAIQEAAASVTVAEGATALINSAFSGFSNLSKVTLPASLREIKASAFYECSNLSKITIPANVTSIGSHAFCNCSSLTSLSIPSAVTSINYNAFYGCSGLTSINLPAGLTQISSELFYGCSSLTEITIPTSVTSIGGYAFGETGLTEVFIPASVTYLPGSAFTYCPELTAITVDAANPNYKSADGALYSKDGTELMTCPAGKSGVFQVPSAVTLIRGNAFNGCDKLTRIRIPSGVTGIAYDAMPLSVGGGDLPASTGVIPVSNAVNGFENMCFNGCSSLTAIEVDAANTVYKSVDGVLLSKDGTGLLCCPQGKSGTLEVPVGVETIAYGAAANCSKLETVRFPASLTEIGSHAFSYSSPSTVVFRGAAPYIDSYAFDSVTATVYYPAGDASWTDEVKQQYGGTLTWVAVEMPKITTQPKSQGAAAGSTVTFTVKATGTAPLSYQWQYRTSSTDSWKKSTAADAKTASLAVKAETYRDGYQYRCLVTNQLTTVISDPATLSIYTKPAITTQPKSVIAQPDATVTFTVKATGADSYQWQYRSSSSGTWANSTLSGCKTATLTVKATTARSGYQYRCKLTNSGGTTISEAATLTVLAKPTITTQPKSQTATAGTTVKFSVTAADATNYQWYYRTSSTGSWAKSSGTGSTTATLSVKAEEYRSGYQYRCRVSNDAGYKYSSAATLTVTALAKPTITTQPKSVSATAGTTVKFTVKATDAVSYQWQYRTSPSGTWKDSSSATVGYNTATLQVSATTARNGYQYRCKVTNTAGTTTSGAATLTVTAAAKPTITTQPKSQTATAGTTVTFTVKATGATSYQWYYRTSSTGEWKKCTGADATTASISVEAKSYRSGYQYRCKVSNDAGYVYTNAVTLTVK